MNISKYGIDLLDSTTVVHDLLLPLFVVIIGGIGTLYIWMKYTEKTKNIEKQNEKRIVSGRLLSEIYRNQKVLEPLFTAAKILESVGSNFSEDIKSPKELKFNRSIYSESSDKFGLLDDESREIIDKYYPELDDIENEYKKLEIIHGVSHSFLYYLLIDFEFNEKLGQIINDNSPGKIEIEEFLRHTKKVYDLGEELIISLKEK